VNSAVYVLDWNAQLFQRLGGRTVVVSANSLEDVRRAREAAERHHVNIHRVILHTRAALALLPLLADDIPNPLALFTAGMGRMQDLVRLLPALRKMDVRIYMPADNEKSLTEVRILASLGIDCAVIFDGGTIRWDLLSDLMTYALLGLVPHAEIEPFSYIAGQYDPKKRAGFGAVYFDDPLTYLHVDAAGRVALTRSDLEAERFFARSIEGVTEESRLAAWGAHDESWSGFFLERSRCAQCPGWRICGGALARRAEADPGCSSFFGELMDVIDQRQTAQKKVKSTWRP
jgi:hypothetical protein